MEKKFNVVIVGGGSAGWMTAAYLSKVLKHGVNIRLIESPNIGTIGVGEATFSTIHLFFDALGLKEQDWMPACNASYKVAIRFVDWNDSRRHFYHPFQRFDMVEGRSLIEWWLKLQRDMRFDYACFSVPAICDRQLAPRYLDGRVFDDKVEGYVDTFDPHRALLLDDLQIQYPYAYHFDASLLAKFLSSYAQERGVIQILDDVTRVSMAEDGSIKSIDLKEHGPMEADLFVDCTGFRGLLINQTLQEPFMSFTESLPCDRAIAMQVPSNPAEDGINPYTTATALSAGWVWDIPLFHRTGTGYVYCSSFLTPEQAEQEFRAHLGKRAAGLNASHIKIRVGRNRNSWVKNCVAIGLSSGFVEPLESTGIFFIQHGIEQLVNYFPSKGMNEASIRGYNEAIAQCIDGVREFLTLHYAASSRSDTPFWKAAKTDLKIPEVLTERMKLWRSHLPTNRTIHPYYHGFEAYSYCVMLIGLGFEPLDSLPVLDHMSHRMAISKFESVQRKTTHLAATLPPLYDYLMVRYGEARATHIGAH